MMFKSRNTMAKQIFVKFCKKEIIIIIECKLLKNDSCVVTTEFFCPAVLLIYIVSISEGGSKVDIHCKCPGKQSFWKYSQHRLRKLKKHRKSPSQTCFLKIKSILTFFGSSIQACECADIELMEMALWKLRRLTGVIPHTRSLSVSFNLLLLKVIKS